MSGIRVQVDGWTLASDSSAMGPGYMASVVAPDGQVVGMGAGFTPEGAVLDTMRTWNTGRTALATALRDAWSMAEFGRPWGVAPTNPWR